MRILIGSIEIGWAFRQRGWAAREAPISLQVNLAAICSTRSEINVCLSLHIISKYHWLLVFLLRYLQSDTPRRMLPHCKQQFYRSQCWSRWRAQLRYRIGIGWFVLMDMSKYWRWKGIVLASYDTTTAVCVCDSAVRNTELGRSQRTVDAILSIIKLAHSPGKCSRSI